MAQPEREDEDGAPEAGYVVVEPAPLASRLVEYGTAAALFVGFVWVRDVPMEAVAGLGTFAAVVLLAKTLFNRLAGLQPMRFRRLKPDGTRYRDWTTYSQAGLFGSLLAGIADFGHEYVAGIGVGGAALAGFVGALVFCGWRQRWNERRLYRETLFAA